jgi:lysophospholipase L1-like esterase
MKHLTLTFGIFLLLMFTEVYSEAQDWANLDRYKSENAKLGPPLKGEKRIVFMGNSITEGWGSLDPEFFKGKHYINRGISGQTTPQMLVRFRADVINLKPTVVVILAGTNDIAGNTGSSTLEMIEDNLTSMAELAKANGILVILSSVLPVFDYPWKPGMNPVVKIAKLNEWIKHYANQHGLIYLDYYSSMADERKGLKSAYTIDGVHPNEAGYKIMAPLTEEAIAKALKQIGVAIQG